MASITCYVGIYKSQKTMQKEMVMIFFFFFTQEDSSSCLVMPCIITMIFNRNCNFSSRNLFRIKLPHNYENPKQLRES